MVLSTKGQFSSLYAKNVYQLFCTQLAWTVLDMVLLSQKEVLVIFSGLKYLYWLDSLGLV